MHIVAIADRPDAEAILQMMLENGFDINTQTKTNGDTVLHLIVEHVELRDSFPLVLRMLEYNPDLSIRNRVFKCFTLVLQSSSSICDLLLSIVFSTLTFLS